MAQNQALPINNDQEKVELFVSCTSIANPSNSSSSSTKVKLYVEQIGNYKLHGETEIIKNNPNPDFSKTFIVDYVFEMTQKLRFEVIHVESMSNQTVIGTVHTTLAAIVGSSRKAMNEGLDIMQNQVKVGKLVVKYEKVSANNNTTQIEFGASLLKTSRSWIECCDVFNMFSADNPVLKLYRMTNDYDYALIYESEVINNTLKPSWKRFEIKVAKLCNSDNFRPVKARVFNRYQYEDTLVGECQFTLDDLMGYKTTKFTLIEPNSKKPTGSLNLMGFKIEEKPDFLDYIRGETQLNIMVGIDFTASNGDPNNFNSLHAIRFDGSMNEYQQAISSVCNILLNYDYDKKVLMYGFGGKPRFGEYTSGTVQHCFSLTGNSDDAWVSELNGIMSAYSNALKNVELSGPTLFAPLLKEAMKIAQENKRNGSLEYTILLIITDGEIHDMEPSINCLIQSAELPLSVIIVGVGSANFDNMNILDGDDGLYNSDGVKAERDLVQFVPFRECRLNAEELAKNVLEEVPTQLVEYMMGQKIKPRPIQKLERNQIDQPYAPSLEQKSVANEYSPLMGYPNSMQLNFEKKR